MTRPAKPTATKPTAAKPTAAKPTAAKPTLTPAAPAAPTSSESRDATAPVTPEAGTLAPVAAVAEAPAGRAIELPASSPAGDAEAALRPDGGRSIASAAGALGHKAANGRREKSPVQLRHDPDAIRHAFETGEFPYATRLTEKAYMEHVLPLQVERL